MKHLKLYEEYTTTTNTTTKFPNLPGAGQPPSSGSGQPRIPLRPGYTPPPPSSGQPRGGSSGQPRVTPTSNDVKEIYFYPDKEQKEKPIRWGWINLKEFDNSNKSFQNYDPSHLHAKGYLYISEQDAKKGYNLPNPSGKYYGLILFRENVAKEGGGGEKVDGVFNFINLHKRKEDEARDENLYNIKFWNFIRDRYYEKNASGRLVRKISKGGFTDNSSADTPDKFA